MLKSRKRSGEEVLFDRSKIERAIEKATPVFRYQSVSTVTS